MRRTIRSRGTTYERDQQARSKSGSEESLDCRILQNIDEIAQSGNIGHISDSSSDSRCTGRRPRTEGRFLRPTASSSCLKVVTTFDGVMQPRTIVLPQVKEIESAAGLKGKAMRWKQIARIAVEMILVRPRHHLRPRRTAQVTVVGGGNDRGQFEAESSVGRGQMGDRRQRPSQPRTQDHNEKKRTRYVRIRGGIFFMICSYWGGTWLIFV